MFITYCYVRTILSHEASNPTFGPPKMLRLRATSWCHAGEFESRTMVRRAAEQLLGSGRPMNGKVLQELADNSQRNGMDIVRFRGRDLSGSELHRAEMYMCFCLDRAAIGARKSLLESALAAESNGALGSRG